jgi:hypothetical protein
LYVHVVVFELWVRRHALFKAVMASVLIVLYGGLPASLILPTAPPWIASEQGLISPTIRVVKDVMSSSSATYDQGARITGNDVAAMPSLRFAITALLSLIFRDVD